MVDIYNNKEAFLNHKPKNIILIVILFIAIFIFLLIVSFKVKIYDTYPTKGFVTCEKSCFITFIMPSNITFQKLKINNKDVDYNLLSKTLDVDTKNYISYYEIVISTNLSLQDKEIVEVNLYYNKQRIIEKIKTKMF